MTPTISAEQRDALYDQILDRLSGIGDIEMAVRAENYEDAERIGREYSDDLRLLLDDLGFGNGGGEPVELSTPPEVLRRILGRLRNWSEGDFAGRELERTEMRKLDERDRLALDACRHVLRDLDKAQAGS